MRDLIALLVEHGVLVVFVTTLAARVGAPVLAAPLLVVAGGLAAGGRIPLLSIAAASIAANVAGDGAWFWIGRWRGQRVLHLLCRVSLSPDSCARQSETMIARWGGSSLTAAKFLPGVSVVAAPMAGAIGMPTQRFLVYALAAGLVWTVVYLALGFAFSEQITQVLDVMASAGVIAATALLLLAAGFVALRYWRRRGALKDAAMARITAHELRDLIRQGHDPVIIDVRSRTSHEIDARRIPGALLVPLEEIAGKATDLPSDREIVLFCSCPNDVSAARAAGLLAERGVARARPLAGGLDAWMAMQPANSHRPWGHPSTEA